MVNVLFLDDCIKRITKFRQTVPWARITTTAHETIDELCKNVPTVLFLDHDLGGQVFVDSEREDCGMEVVRWLERSEINIPYIIVHSWNEQAAMEMCKRLHDSGYTGTYAPFDTIQFKEIVEALV